MAHNRDYETRKVYQTYTNNERASIMNRYLVQHWYLDEFGNDVLKSEVVFETCKEARSYVSALQRRHNGFHSFDIVLMVSKYRYHCPKSIRR